jgi:septal ring factor EnvC (AmiA/AmiB activator)
MAKYTEQTDIENIKNEIEHLSKCVKEIKDHFTVFDECFLLSKKELRNLADEIIMSAKTLKGIGRNK